MVFLVTYKALINSLNSFLVNFIVIDVANRYLEDVTPTVKQFEIFSTPTYIIFDNNGDEIYRSVGYSAQKNKLSEILSNASKN